MHFKAVLTFGGLNRKVPLNTHMIEESVGTRLRPIMVSDRGRPWI